MVELLILYVYIKTLCRIIVYISVAKVSFGVLQIQQKVTHRPSTLSVAYWEIFRTVKLFLKRGDNYLLSYANVSA